MWRLLPPPLVMSIPVSDTYEPLMRNSPDPSMSSTGDAPSAAAISIQSVGVPDRFNTRLPVVVWVPSASMMWSPGWASANASARLGDWPGVTST
ncbi:hypothetical protein BMS3Bbin02_01767 [bacterium BMS3Bbin02]|nr:hypothetical protein BMS3Bbin02_01767 [bacterium BMS3Bbin02]